MVSSDITALPATFRFDRRPIQARVTRNDGNRGTGNENDSAFPHLRDEQLNDIVPRSMPSFSGEKNRRENGQLRQRVYQKYYVKRIKLV